MARLRIIVLWMLLGAGAAAWAQDLEIITLKHRFAEELIPQLQPMLAPGAALTGRHELLFLRTTPANLEQVRQVLAALDRPLRRLLISVRHAGQQTAQGGGVAVGGQIASGDGRVVISTSDGSGRTVTRTTRNVVRGSVTESQHTRNENLAQQVQTVEGGRAWINVGQSVPIAIRQVVQTPQGPMVSDSVGYREIGSGFYVEPRLSGAHVTLAISTANDAPGALPGSVEVRRVVSTVSGRLGEWIALGGSTQQSSQDGRGLTGYGSSGASEDRQVWLKVDEQP